MMICVDDLAGRGGMQAAMHASWPWEVSDWLVWWCMCVADMSAMIINATVARVCSWGVSVLHGCLNVTPWHAPHLSIACSMIAWAQIMVGLL